MTGSLPKFDLTAFDLVLGHRFYNKVLFDVLKNETADF